MSMPQRPRPLDDSASWEAWFGVELRNWRTTRKLSTTALGALVHVSKTTIERIEKAERPCDRALAAALDDALEAGGALRRLWRRVEEHADATSTDADRQRTTGPPSLGASRSNPLTPARSRAAVLGFDDPLDVIARADALTRSDSNPALLAMATSSVESLVSRYEEMGPHRLSGETRLLRRTLHTALDGHQPPRIRTELFALTARVSGLLGYMAVNAGTPYPLADAYCTEAQALAREAGDTDLQMWALGTRSLGLYYAGRYAEAAQAATSGIDLAPKSPQAIRLLVNGLARAAARQQDSSVTARAIGQAMDLADNQPSLPGGLTPCISFAPYSRARMLANAITAHVSLGDVHPALMRASEIDDLIEHSQSDWSRALVRLDVATVLLRQQSPDIEQAMALGRSALHAGSGAPIRSVWQRANELNDLAARWPRVPAVREYADELRAWQSQPQAKPLVDGSRPRTAP